MALKADMALRTDVRAPNNSMLWHSPSLQAVFKVGCGYRTAKSPC